MKAPSVLLTAAALNVLMGIALAAPVPEHYHYDDYDTNNELIVAGAATFGAGLIIGTLGSGYDSYKELKKQQAELDQAKAENALHTEINNLSDADLYQALVDCWTAKINEVHLQNGKQAAAALEVLSHRIWGMCMAEHHVSHSSPVFRRAPPAIDVVKAAPRPHEHGQSMSFARAAPAAIQHNMARLSRWGSKEMHALTRGAAAAFHHPSRVGSGTAAAAAAERRLAVEGL
ncbi:MAG: hypothetical protein M1826_004089 [Phylliscum demangeonii]|nr:MAG: hypothetical protein M1826_004089 [Phylliscum demangeonii]